MSSTSSWEPNPCRRGSASASTVNGYASDEVNTGSVLHYINAAILRTLLLTKKTLNQLSFTNLYAAVVVLLRLALDAWTSLPLLLQLLILFYGFFKLYKKMSTSFQAYLDLGRGGTPSTLRGWIRIQWLGLFRIPSVLEPPHVDPMLEPYRGLLENIPKRQGTRPIVGGVAPQRQTDQKTSRTSFNTLVSLMIDFAAQYPTKVEVTQSFLEGHLPALRGKPSKTADKRPETRLFGYEIVHPHRNDGSLHMIMHPEDVRTVVESGWGERHPLARANWWWVKFWPIYAYTPRRPPVPETLVFVYAPRNDHELQVVKQLLIASAWWITGDEQMAKDLDVVPEVKTERRGMKLRTRSSSCCTRANH